MSHYTQTFLPSTDRFNYTMITPQYSPDTTIAISLRHFEKEARAEAEKDYDAKRGPLPDTRAEDDDSININERSKIKKGRKVRSAIVSRKKTAIYEKKLERELELRDNFNAELKARLSVSQDILRDIKAKINSMQRTLDARKDVPKRMRTALPPQPVSFNPVPQQSNLFFQDDDPIDEILSFHGEEPRPVQPLPKSFSSLNDTSKCSDRQISPMLQAQRPESIPRDLSSCLPVEDNSWKSYLPQNVQPQNVQQPVVHQMLGAAPSFSM